MTRGWGIERAMCAACEEGALSDISYQSNLTFINQAISGSSTGAVLLERRENVKVRTVTYTLRYDQLPGTYHGVIGWNASDQWVGRPPPKGRGACVPTAAPPNKPTNCTKGANAMDLSWLRSPYNNTLNFPDQDAVYSWTTFQRAKTTELTRFDFGRRYLFWPAVKGMEPAGCLCSRVSATTMKHLGDGLGPFGHDAELWERDAARPTTWDLLQPYDAEHPVNASGCSSPHEACNLSIAFNDTLQKFDPKRGGRPCFPRVDKPTQYVGATFQRTNDGATGLPSQLTGHIDLYQHCTYSADESNQASYTRSIDAVPINVALIDPTELMAPAACTVCDTCSTDNECRHLYGASSSCISGMCQFA